MVKEGYKQTEVGVIPEDWEVVKLKQLYNITSSKRVFQSEWRKQGVPFYRAREIAVMSEGKEAPEDLFITREMYDAYTKQYGSIRENDVLITGVGTLGKVYVVRASDRFYFKDGNIIWLQWKGKSNSKYIKFLYDTTYVQRQIFDNAGGSTVGTYTISNAQETIVAVPGIREQNEIAEALSDIDELISSLEKLIAKKKAIKQGAMQQLLTGKTCLNYPSLGWEGVRLGDVVNTSSGGTPSREIVRYYEGNIPWITTSELNDCRIYDSIEHITNEAIKNSSAKMFPAGTILMAMYGATIGKLGILEVESTTNQACCAMMCTSRVFNLYLYYYLLSIRDEIISLGSGAGQPNISQQIVKNLPLKLPKYEEQVEIGSVLHDIDTEIDNLELKMKKQQQLKQGMMQQVLTGKIRLM